MTIRSEFDDQNAVLWVRPEPSFSIADLSGYFRASVADERLVEPFIEVVSLSGVEAFDLRVVDIQSTTPLLIDFIDQTGVQATIFVGDPGLQFGIANMLAGLLSTYQPGHRILTTEDEGQIPAVIAQIRELESTEGE